MNSVADLEKLGYRISLAHGSAAVEETALAEAEGLASPHAVQHDVNRVAEAVAREASAKGLVGQQQIDIVAKATAQALSTITEARNDKVDAARRALLHAQGTPDVLVINGPGIQNLYVKCKPDGTGWDEDAQAVLDSLADKKAHKERVTQHEAT